MHNEDNIYCYIVILYIDYVIIDYDIIDYYVMNCVMMEYCMIDYFIILIVSRSLSILSIEFIVNTVFSCIRFIIVRRHGTVAHQ